jgi:hypothetical protein
METNNILLYNVFSFSIAGIPNQGVAAGMMG